MRTLALAALLAAVGQGADSADRRAEAARLYEQGRHEEAAARYEALARERPLDASLHYDLGNALYRSGRLGRAVASYQRAFDLAPRDADVRYNLDLALSRAGESLVPPGVPKALFLLLHGLSSAELEVLFWLGLWAAGVLGGLCLLKESWQPRLRPLAAAGAVLWAAAGLWWAVRRTGAAARPAVLVAAETEVRSGPGRTFPVSFKAPEGRRVTLMSERTGWLEIGVLKEGLKGWVPADAVEKI